MTTLHMLSQFLAATLRQDPALTLAQAVAWLDPILLYPILLYPEEDALDALYYSDIDDEAALTYALSVARRCFPEIYVETIRRIRAGWDYGQITNFYCDALAECHPYIDLCYLHDMAYGIPCQWEGVELSLLRFPDEHPDLAAFLQGFFDITPHSNRSGYCFDAVDVEMAHKIAVPITQSLIREMRQPCADLAFLMMWIFGTSGNSLIDCSREEYYDYGHEPLDWEPDTLKMVDEAHAYAAIILSAAKRGLGLLQTNDAIAETFRHNVTRIETALKRENTHAHINWPRWADTSASGGTDADATLVHLRHYYAPED